ESVDLLGHLEFRAKRASDSLDRRVTWDTRAAPGPPAPPGMGEPGAMGDRGVQGERGLKGLMGETGDHGVPGESVSCGVKCKETPMELVFVIDSFGPEKFEIIKDFVTRLVDRVTVGRNATRIGLVLYSLDVRLEFNLARYITKQDVKQAVWRMHYMGEGTYTATAIHKATQEAFFSTRDDVRKREPVKLDLAVREAHAANIEMYALGIVNSSDPTQAEFLQELNLVASDPDSEYMYLIDDFNTLPALESQLVSQFCEDENGALIYNRLTNSNGNGQNGVGYNGNGLNGYGDERQHTYTHTSHGNNGYVKTAYETGVTRTQEDGA
ncbi:hypothetical protein CRUP_012351, partial [Coryphaenoides rupestris]